MSKLETLDQNELMDKVGVTKLKDVTHFGFKNRTVSVYKSGEIIFWHPTSTAISYSRDHVELLKIAIKEFEQANYRSEAEIE